DKITVLNLASAASFQAFESKINKLREEIFMPIRGAYMPFLEGQGGSGLSGNRDKTHKIASDAMESFSALDVMLLLNRGLVPYLHLPNFGPGVGMPELALGKAGEDEVEARLKNIKTVIKEIGLPGSKTQIYEEARMIAPDPNDPDDVLGGEEKDNTSTVTAVSQLQAQVKGAQVDRDAAIEN